MGISGRELGVQKRGAEGGEIETPKASRRKGVSPSQPTRRSVGALKTGFGAFSALKNPCVDKKKFSIFDIFCDT